MKKWLVFLVIILVLGGLIAWRFQQKKAQDAGGPMGGRGGGMMRGGPASVELTGAQLRDITKSFEATGTVESMQNVNISPKVGGRIDYLEVREGDRVTQGQVLARINQSSVQAQVRQQQAQLAETKYRLAQAQLNQTSTDVDVTTQIRQQVANLSSAQAGLRQAEQTQAAQVEAIKASLDDAQNKIDNAAAAIASVEADQRLAEQSYVAQLAANDASIEDAQGKIENVSATVANANAGIGSAQASLDNATAKYNRTNELFKKGFISAQAVEDAKTAVSVQQASVTTANGQLKAAQAALASAQAQKKSVVQQADIAKLKADTGRDSTRAKVTQAKTALASAQAQLRSIQQQTAITRANAAADVTAAQARVEQANASLESARANSSQSPAYRQNLEALKAAVAVAQASLDSARAQLDDTVLRSPLDGVVTARNQDPGAMASPGQPILTVQSLNHIWVTIAVPEDVSVKVHLNQKATVAFDALDGKVFPARVAQINPSADLESRQFTVRVILNNASHLFSPGMFARVNLITEEADGVVAVPREAVKQDKDGSSFVFMAGKDGTAHKQTVMTGLSDANWISIATGLQANAQVVTMSAMPLNDGQQISTGRGRGGQDGREWQGRSGGRPGGGRPGGGQWQGRPGGGNAPGGDSAGPPTRGGRTAPAGNTPGAGPRRGAPASDASSSGPNRGMRGGE